MDVFYHVTQIQKRRKCSISFCYIRDQKTFILGDIHVYRKRNKPEISFGESSEEQLNDMEKQFIINRILRNLYIYN